MEPTIEQGICAEVVRVRRPLEQSYPSEHLELLSPLVEVDQTVRYRVGYRGVYHREVRQEGPQIRYGSVADVLNRRKRFHIVTYHSFHKYYKICEFP